MASGNELATEQQTPLLSAPVLTSVSEAEWGEFLGAVGKATEFRGRDTEAEVLLRVVAQDDYSLDVRKRSLYTLADIRNEGRVVHSTLNMAVIDSREPDKFLDEARGLLERALGEDRGLAEYGAELGINFFESGSHKDVIGYNSAAATMLGASLPYLGHNEGLSSRAVNAIAGTVGVAGNTRLRRSEMIRTAGHAVTDPRLDVALRKKLFDSIGDDDLMAHRKKLVVASAVDEFDPQTDTADILESYFDDLYDAIASGQITLEGFNLVPAGLENIDKLEQIVGSVHAYTHLVVGSDVWGLYSNVNYRDGNGVEKAVASAHRVQDPILRRAATQVALAARSKERERNLKWDSERQAAAIVLNGFLTMAKQNKP